DLTKTNPLHLAVRFGHAGASELLLKGKANPNSSDEQGHVAINDAVAKDRFDLVTKLLEHGALVNVRNMAGLEAISFSRTPQMQSIIMKHDVNF
ncbi:Tnks, partial [Symbiodinium pilosum]